jgi:hypothetical protein
MAQFSDVRLRLSIGAGFNEVVVDAGRVGPEHREPLAATRFRRSEDVKEPEDVKRQRN